MSGQRICACRHETACFRVIPDVGSPLCWPCESGNEMHGYGAALVAEASQRGLCEVCFTVSWEPTDDGERCGHCALYAAYLAMAQHVERPLAVERLTAIQVAAEALLAPLPPRLDALTSESESVFSTYTVPLRGLVTLQNAVRAAREG